MGCSLFLVVSLLAGAHAAQYIDTCSDNDAGPSIHFLMDAADDNNVLENLVQKIEKPSPLPIFLVLLRFVLWPLDSWTADSGDGLLLSARAQMQLYAQHSRTMELNDIMSW